MEIKLNRQVFDKNKFNETVDTSFSQLGKPEEDLSFFDVNLATVEDFFTLYNKFFFEIPKEGVANSHTLLVVESGDYINIERDNEQVNLLTQEISELRTDNLELRKENTDYIIKLYGNQKTSDVSFVDPKFNL
jgi:hypothetical protein